MGLGAEDSNEDEDEEVDWDEIMRKLRKLFSGEINEYSTEDDILNADLDLKFLANTDIPVVEISQSGIYFINENGEIIWFADINTSGGYGTIVTTDWMDAETAKAHFLAMAGVANNSSFYKGLEGLFTGSGAGLITGFLLSNWYATGVGFLVAADYFVQANNLNEISQSYYYNSHFTANGVISVLPPDSLPFHTVVHIHRL